MWNWLKQNDMSDLSTLNYKLVCRLKNTKRMSAMENGAMETSLGRNFCSTPHWHGTDDPNIQIEIHGKCFYQFKPQTALEGRFCPFFFLSVAFPTHLSKAWSIPDAGQLCRIGLAPVTHFLWPFHLHVRRSFTVFTCPPKKRHQSVRPDDKIGGW